MTQIEVQPTGTWYRGTWDQVRSQMDAIPGTSKVEVKVMETKPNPDPISPEDPAIALLESWIARAPTDPEMIREAEEDLLEFKRNMNLPRKEIGARLHFPEVE